jgi:hypothetical protein
MNVDLVMDENKPVKISTTTLAKHLEVPAQQLFSTLKDFGWIRKLDEGWALSTKGEFEGGEYVHSKRYGRYIVWPEQLVEHPLLQALEDNRHVSATAIGKKSALSARQVNRALAELGWIKHGFQGWELTPLGEVHGGIQLENDNSGTFYVVWPESIQKDSVFSKALALCVDMIDDDVSLTLEDDLFAEQTDFRCIDGHQHDDKALLQICHWLYMSGIAHACNRQLPVEEEIAADFYLPAHHVYIDYWQDDGKDLSLRLRRKELYKKLQLTAIDIEKDDLTQLDEVLTRQLRKLGIRVY